MGEKVVLVRQSIETAATKGAGGGEKTNETYVVRCADKGESTRNGENGKQQETSF